MDREQRQKHILELARKAIQELKPDLALEHLRGIRREVEDLPGTSISAEHQLLYAGALGASNAEGAQSEYESALHQVCNLHVPDIALEIRAHEDYGNYLRRFTRHRTVAREQYVLAKQLAIESNLPEDSSRLELDIVSLDLQINEDPRLATFQRIKKIALELGCTSQQQLQGWILFCGENEEQEYMLVAARKRREPSEEYLRGLLASLKSDSR
jgi:hypothetical protein